MLCFIFSWALLEIDNDSRLFFLCDLEVAVSGVVLLDSDDAVEAVEAAAGAGASLFFSPLFFRLDFALRTTPLISLYNY